MNMKAQTEQRIESRRQKMLDTFNERLNMQSDNERKMINNIQNNL